MWDVTFAIQRATGAKRGTFVTITGGPGYAGVSAADDYADYWDPGIAEHYDIVFADQRGTGLSHQITCPAATSTYYGTDADPKDPADVAAVRAAASTYVKDCMTESKADPADLPFYATSQAIDDLEAFREYWTPTSSSCLRRATAPSSSRPTPPNTPSTSRRCSSMGRSTLVPDGITYYTEAARAWDDVLVSTTAACQADAACKLDTQGGDLMAAYDALIKKLEAGPIMVRFPLADGRSRTGRWPRRTSRRRPSATATARSDGPSSCVP
jgi:hypothetical protein